MSIFTGDSSIHLCKASDDFYRDLDVASPYLSQGESKKMWTATDGAWELGGGDVGQEGYIYCTNSTQSNRLLTTGSYLNAAITVDIKTMDDDGTGHHTGGLIGRRIDSDNYYFLYPYMDGTVELWRVSAGFPALAVSTINAPYDSVFEWNNFVFKFNDANIKIYINDELQIDWDDTAGWDSGTGTFAQSGSFGLQGHHCKGAYKKSAIFNMDSTSRGTDWYDFYMDGYDKTEKSPVSEMRIPGRIGNKIQISAPDSAQINLVGKVMQRRDNLSASDFIITEAHKHGESGSLDQAITNLRRNAHPVYIRTPTFTTSGYVRNYDGPNFLRNSDRNIANFNLELIEAWQYE